jgi:alpha-beta hydrolase superfamily lysophospholipase
MASWLRWSGGLLWRLAAAALALYAGGLALLWWGQERLLFHPTPLPQAHGFDFGPDVHELWVDVPGARLHALHLRLAQPRGVVFYLHGNAGNLQTWFVNADIYRRAGMDLVMLDYRGYGKSSGRIESQAQLLDDVRAAWAAVAPRYAGRRRVILGRSIGTGLAATLAAEVQPELTVLISPYLSMQALAAEHYPGVPAAVLRYPLRTDLVLPQVQGAVLLVHGSRDRLIPPHHSQQLRARVPRAALLLVPGAGHNDLQDHPHYRDGLAAALAPR